MQHPPTCTATCNIFGHTTVGQPQPTCSRHSPKSAVSCTCRKAAQASKAAKEEAADAQQELEVETDAPGVFALINARLDAPRLPADPLEIAEPAKAPGPSKSSKAAGPSLVAEQVSPAHLLWYKVAGVVCSISRQCR